MLVTCVAFDALRQLQTTKHVCRAWLCTVKAFKVPEVGYVQASSAACGTCSFDSMMAGRLDAVASANTLERVVAVKLMLVKWTTLLILADYVRQFLTSETTTLLSIPRQSLQLNKADLSRILFNKTGDTRAISK